MNVFDHVIAGLEQRGAFKDVSGAVMPREIMGKLEAARAFSDFPDKIDEQIILARKPAAAGALSLKFAVFKHRIIVSQPETDWQFRSFYIGLKAYRPDKLFMPWYRAYSKRAIHRPLSRKTMRLMKINMQGIDSGINFIISERGKTSTIRMSQAEQEEEKIKLENLQKVIQHHPQFLVALTLFQTANLDFLYQLALRIRNTTTLNAEQRKIAATAIEEITISMSQDNFLINLGRAIAHTYHTRIQKEQGDYTKPMMAEDFTKTWQEFADTDGFKTDVAMGDGTMITIRCPFGPAANHQSAVDVGSEVCQSPEARKGSAAHLGYGLWCMYAALSASPMARLHRMQVAISQWKIKEKVGKALAMDLEGFSKNTFIERTRTLCSTIRSEADNMSKPIRRLLGNVIAMRYSVQGLLPKYNR